MKRIIYTFCLAVAPLLFQSCDNLDLAPEDFYASGNYWKNEAQVENFATGLHNELRSQFIENAQRIGEWRGATLSTEGNLCGSQTRFSNYINNIISEDTPIHTNWSDFYGRILQVNHMIENLENGCAFLSDNSKNYYKGIAYGMRAYYYFWLYRMYGGVPLELSVKVTGDFTQEDLYMERASAEATLQQIKEDVKASLEGFNATNKSANYYHWSKNASLMLKAEVYIWSAKVTTDDAKEAHIATGSADLEIAKSALTEITGKKLEDDFGKLFTEGGKLKNDEVILAIYLDKDEYTARDYFRRFVHHNNFNGTTVVDKHGTELTGKNSDPLNVLGDGLQNEEWKTDFVNSYDETDSRRVATFFEFFRKEDGKPGNNMIKFLGQTQGTVHSWDADVILYRYADAVLMLAEIENGLTGKCANYINQIRKRAYGDNFSDEVKYTDGSYAENELAILHERDKEFVGEGKRWFDVLRLHDANKKPLVFSTAAGYEDANGYTNAILSITEAYKVLWPIEMSLITNDPKLTQTVNYPTKTK